MPDETMRERDARWATERRAALSVHQVRQLEAQQWTCAYPCEDGTIGGRIFPGDELAIAYDGHGIVHLRCAFIGRAPAEKEG